MSRSEEDAEPRSSFIRGRSTDDSTCSSDNESDCSSRRSGHCNCRVDERKEPSRSPSRRVTPETQIEVKDDYDSRRKTPDTQVEIHDEDVNKDVEPKPLAQLPSNPLPLFAESLLEADAPSIPPEKPITDFEIPYPPSDETSAVLVAYPDLHLSPINAGYENAQAAIQAGDGNIQVDSEALSSDAGYESDSLSSGSTSLSSSVREYAFENGRRYHKFREGRYNFPNDDVEQEREDMKHSMIAMLCQRLHFAPIGEYPQEILDIGTGTGSWAIESKL
jgi:hypothetical protein